MDEATTDLLRDIAAQLGVTVDYLWTTAVEGMFYQGVSFLLWAGVWIAVTILLHKSGHAVGRWYDEALKLYEANHRHVRPSSEDYTAVQTILRVASLGSAIASSGCAINGVMYFARPEFEALRWILKLIQQ